MTESGRGTLDEGGAGHLRSVAIDGPAASGKSTVGHLVARRINFLYFDTGVMYRAVTWSALQQGIDPRDGNGLGTLAETLVIEIEPPRVGTTDGRLATVRIDGQDTTWLLRSQAVDANVSVVAASARVRIALTGQQRRIGLHYGRGRGEKPGIVMIGRDIGTVVLPEAPLKVFLEAPVEERARRRHQELRERGKDVRYERVLADMRRRDEIDSQRAMAPLRPAADALVIQTRGLSVAEISDQILERVEQLFGSLVSTGSPSDGR